MIGGKTIVQRGDAARLQQYNLANGVGGANRRDEVRRANVNLEVSVAVKSMKGPICAVYPYSQRDLYYGEFSNVLKVNTAAPTKRTMVYKSLNYIFDIGVDYSGRIIVAEGFGFVKIIGDKGSCSTLQHKVYWDNEISAPLIVLNQDRTKLYFIRDDRRHVVEVQLNTLRSKVFRIGRYTQPHDRVLSICSYKSELYALTSEGYVFILNTVQQKVILTRQIQGFRGQIPCAQICREGEYITIAEYLGFNNRTHYYSLHLLTKTLHPVQTVNFERTLSGDIHRVNPNHPCYLSRLVMVPRLNRGPIVFLSTQYTTLPLKVLAVDGGNLNAQADISEDRVSSRLTDLKYSQGILILVGIDKQIRTINLDR